MTARKLPSGHTWEEGGNEHIVSARVPQVGDIISWLGTPHDQHYMLLTPLEEGWILHDVVSSLRPKPQPPKRYQAWLLDLKTNTKACMDIFDHYSYRLVNSVEIS